MSTKTNSFQQVSEFIITIAIPHYTLRGRGKDACHYFEVKVGGNNQKFCAVGHNVVVFWKLKMFPLQTSLQTGLHRTLWSNIESFVMLIEFYILADYTVAADLLQMSHEFWYFYFDWNDNYVLGSPSKLLWPGFCSGSCSATAPNKRGETEGLIDNWLAMGRKVLIFPV